MVKIMRGFKNAALVCLTASMCVLCYLTLILMGGEDTGAILSNIIKKKDLAVTYQSGGGTHIIAAVPYRISVITEGSIYTQNAVLKSSDIYKSTERFFFEAIGSMHDTRICTKKEWETAVTKKGILVSFSGKLPMSLMKAWAESSGTEPYEIKLAGFSYDNQGVSFFFKDELTGICYKSKTSAAQLSFDEISEKYKGDNGVFLKDAVKIYGDVDIEVLSKNTKNARVYSISGDKYSFEASDEDSILKSFDINPYFAKSYQESTGVKVYVEEGHILKADLLGRLTYSATGGGIRLNTDNKALSYEEVCARSINKLWEISEVLLKNKSNMNIDVMSVKKNTDSIEILCALKIDGISIYSSSFGIGAIIKGEEMTNIWFDIPNITQTGEITLMSDVMAANIEKSQRGSMEIIYKQQDTSLIPALAIIED